MNDISPSIPSDIDLGNIEFVLIGEAPGAEEKKIGQPFVGASGKLLTKTCDKLGLGRNKIYITNVFWTRPPDNQVADFFAKPSDGVAVCEDLPQYKGMRLKEEWRYEIERLDEELYNLNPKIIVCVGATSLWALTGMDKITHARGKVTKAGGGCLSKSAGLKVLPTFHPAYVLRNRSALAELEADLELARSYTSIKPEEMELFEF